MRRVLVLIWVSVASISLAWGWTYYRTPVAERPFTELDPLLAPTGLVGHGYGIVGTAMIATGVVAYAARKRWSRLEGVGKLRTWLDVHIFLCTLGPFLVLLHTTFKFGGIVSIAFWSMAIVVASGVFGRYVYARIPKTLNGIFLARDVLEDRRHRLEQEISDLFDSLRLQSLPSSGTAAFDQPRSLPGALATAVRFDFSERVRTRRLKAELVHRGVDPGTQSAALDLIGERRRLEHQALLLVHFRRLFHYWHVFHIPLAIVMTVILLVHVSVAVLFGYTWIF